ncbi:hypothetical protein IT575_07555 [bacterium]|nr:hypothetical protein [bacterium]
MLALLLLCSPAQAARRSRVERKPLYKAPLLQPLGERREAEAGEMLTAEDLSALAPAGCELLLDQPRPAGLRLSGDICLDKAEPQLLLRLALAGREAQGQPVYGQDGRFWDTGQRLWPYYECRVSLRSAGPGEHERLLESFDASAHNAYLRALEAPLPALGDPQRASYLSSSLAIAGPGRSTVGREFLAWDELAGFGIEGRHAAERSGELLCMLSRGKRVYLLSLRFEAEACEHDLDLTRNLAACIAMRLTDRRIELWPYLAADPDKQAHDFQPEWSEEAESVAHNTVEAMPPGPDIEDWLASLDEPPGAGEPRTEEDAPALRVIPVHPEAPAEKDDSEDESEEPSSGELWAEPRSGDLWAEPGSAETWAEAGAAEAQPQHSSGELWAQP